MSKQQEKSYITGYNGKICNVKLTLIHNDKNSSFNNEIPLETKNINTIIIDNDIQSLSPKLTVIYTDPINLVAKILNMNDCLLSVVISFEDDPSVELSAVFFINYSKIINRTINSIMYEFVCIHKNNYYLQKTINYATVKLSAGAKPSYEDKPESPLKIIKNILQSIDYSNSFGVLYVNDTTNQIHYINGQSMQVKDQINYLLKRTPSINDPPSYFVHNILDDKPLLINNKLYQDRLENLRPVKDGQKKNFNSFKLYGYSSPIMIGTTSNINEVCELSDVSFNAGINSYIYFGNHNFYDFNQQNRTWKKTQYNWENINNLLNNNIKDIQQLETILPNSQNIKQAKYEIDYPNFSHEKIYNNLRNVQIGMNCIKFKTIGHLTRDAGQYVLIDCSDDSEMKRFGGLWNIHTCRHLFKNDLYINEYICYRTNYVNMNLNT